MTATLRQALARRAPFEEPVSFPVEGQEVRGVRYLPDARRMPAPAVLLCHGFTGSRNADQRLFVWTARALALNGLGALAIDFRGSGESEGDFAAMTPETEIADVKAALDFLAGDLRVDRTRLGAIGHSLGGLVAACAAGDDRRIRSLALWAAVADAGLLAKLCEERSSTGAGWDCGGLEVGAAFRDVAMDMDVQRRFARSAAPVLIVHGTEDETVSFAHAEHFVENANERARHFHLHPIEGGDHCFRSLAWREELLTVTIRWFRETLLSGNAAAGRGNQG